MNKNCLSYWFPLIRAAGLPVPPTKIVRTSADLIHLLDGRKPDGWPEFIQELRSAVSDIGTPCFLRTGQGSGKHDWERTCYLQDIEQLERHVAALVEWSECVQLIGLPYDVWVVRKMLPTEPVAVLPRYGNMPLCREFRCFVDDGDVRCVHPYWPREAIVQGMDEVPDDLNELYEKLSALSANDADNVRSLASRAGEAVTGSWSVDVFRSKNGWSVTDMAIAELSYHWKGCKASERSGANDA